MWPHHGLRRELDLQVSPSKMTRSCWQQRVLVIGLLLFAKVDFALGQQRRWVSEGEVHRYRRRRLQEDFVGVDDGPGDEQAEVSQFWDNILAYGDSFPTTSPTPVPVTPSPSDAATNVPTIATTRAPTHAPTGVPTIAITSAPSQAPVNLILPTRTPSEAPSAAPTTGSPPTLSPSVAPHTALPSPNPTNLSTQPVSTPSPTAMPAAVISTSSPTRATFSPTESLTTIPPVTPAPTAAGSDPLPPPFSDPTDPPAIAPTMMPTPDPFETMMPTPDPETEFPSSLPSVAPSSMPSDMPTEEECDVELNIRCVSAVSPQDCETIPAETNLNCLCTECAQELRFSYTARPCDDNQGPPGQCIDSDGLTPTSPARLVIEGDGVTFFEGEAEAGDSISINGEGSCLPDLITISVFALEDNVVLQTVILNSGCDGEDSLKLLEPYGSIEFIGYTCQDEVDANNCFVDVAFLLSTCNEHENRELVVFGLDFDLNGNVIDLLSGNSPRVLIPMECLQSFVPSTVNRCVPEDFMTMAMLNASKSFQGPLTCVLENELMFNIFNSTMR